MDVHYLSERIMTIGKRGLDSFQRMLFYDWIIKLREGSTQIENSKLIRGLVRDCNRNSDNEMPQYLNCNDV